MLRKCSLFYQLLISRVRKISSIFKTFLDFWYQTALDVINHCVWSSFTTAQSQLFKSLHLWSQTNRLLIGRRLLF